MMLLAEAHFLAHLNAVLNGLATVLLIVGYVLIRQRKEKAHIQTMVAAFVTSIAFLISYLAYHFWPVGAKATPFPGPSWVKYAIYLPVLISHIVLAAAVPILAILTMWLGWNIFRQEDPVQSASYRRRHRRVARWTWPIWLYVSVTGVAVYVMLYQLYQ